MDSNSLGQVIGTIITILIIIGWWKMFTKAGVPGWHSIIPFLDIYDLTKIAMKDNVVLFTVLGIIFPVVLIYTYIKLAKAFGKGTGYGVALFFLGFIFIPILGFGSDTYLGAQ